MTTQSRARAGRRTSVIACIRSAANGEAATEEKVIAASGSSGDSRRYGIPAAAVPLVGSSSVYRGAGQLVEGESR